MKKIVLAGLLLLIPNLMHAYEEPDPEVSTAPIGSSFYRHLAFDMNLNLRELVKFEKRGFGHGEIITLILISKNTGVPLKDYGKRRLKEKISLRDLAVEAKMDYDTLSKNVRALKEGIDAKGDALLPPPLFEIPAADAPKKEEKTKKKKGKHAEPTPSPTATPTPSTIASPVPAPSARPFDPKQTELE